MRFLIVGDLHGNKPRIHYKEFDAIIAPGDFCSDKLRKYMFQAIQKRMKNPDSIIEWYDLTGKRKAKKMIKKSLSDGRRILEYLDSFNVPVYIVPGNWDWIKDKDSDWSFLKKDHYKRLIKGFENIIDMHNKILELKECSIIGYGISSGPEYPQYKEELEMLEPGDRKKKKEEYDKKFKRIGNLFKKAKKPIIFLSHNVPFNTLLDKITDNNSPRYGYHYGSLVARKIIEKHKPLICIGGHMHEHFGKCKVRETVCVNAGFGSYVNSFLELGAGKIKRLEFHKEK